MTKDEVRELILKAKEPNVLTWEGYGRNLPSQLRRRDESEAVWAGVTDEAEKIVACSTAAEAAKALMSARTAPGSPWPPTDPFSSAS